MEPLRSSADEGVVKNEIHGRDPLVATVVVTLADVAPTDLGRQAFPRIAHDLSRTVAAPADAASPARIWRWTVAVQGTCRRASTTTADRRRDALFTATRFIETAKRIVRFEPARLGATITHAPCEPSSAQDVPGQHVLCLELRDTDPATIGRIYERLVAEAWTIGRLSSSTFAFTPFASNPTVLYEVSDEPAVAAPPSSMMPGRMGQLAADAVQNSRAG
jgi:hypothetical protein